MTEYYIIQNVETGKFLKWWGSTTKWCRLDAHLYSERAARTNKALLESAGCKLKLYKLTLVD